MTNLCLCGGRRRQDGISTGIAPLLNPGRCGLVQSRCEPGRGWLWAKAVCGFIAWVTLPILSAKKFTWKCRSFFFFFSCQLYLPWQNPIVNRMGACWLSTNRYQVMGAKRQIRKVFIGLSLCLLVFMSTLNWFELVFLQISGSGGIEWEGESKEEASELVFCCFLFSSFGCFTVLVNFPRRCLKIRDSLLCSGFFTV